MKNIIPTSFSSSKKIPTKQNTFYKHKHNPNNSNQILNITNDNNESICCSLEQQSNQNKNIPLHKTETTKSISSTEEQPTPKQIPKVFVSQSSFTYYIPFHYCCSEELFLLCQFGYLSHSPNFHP